MFARLMTTKQALRREIVSQFHHPQGPLGHVAGWIMGTRRSNVERNRWAVQQLEIPDGGRVLEIGFGPGVAIEALVERAPTARIVGLDHSELMVRTASRRNRDAITRGQVDLRHGRAQDLDPAWAPLDVVLAVNNLGMWDEPTARLIELRELLRVGGTISIGSQPRHAGADEVAATRAADEIAAMLAEAGYVQIARQRLDLRPPMMLVTASRGDVTHFGDR
jgi:trans-aconitate methyltransferase